MGKDRLRVLEWGKGKRPSASNKIGVPNPREGGEGDIQVRHTSIGARLFAKIGGKWLSSFLYGDEIDDPNIIVPKAWYKLGRTTDSDTFADQVFLPDYINQENILGILFGITTSANNYDFWSQGNKKIDASNDEADAVDAVVHGADYNVRVRYHSGSNYILIQSPDYTGRPTMTPVKNKQFKLTEFFK